MIQEEVKRRRKSLFPHSNLKPDVGITLAELLIVLALTMVVAGLAYSFFHFVNSSFAEGGVQYQLQSGISLATDFITDELRNATEFEIIATPFVPDASYQYIYIEDQVLKHRREGTVQKKSEKILTNETMFSVRQDEDTGRCYVTLNLYGGKKNQKFTLSTEFMLNNVSAISGLTSGKAIRYRN